jgi:transposase
MKEIKTIKKLKNNDGKSFRKIVAETGHAFETVRKYAEKEDFNFEPRPVQSREGKMTPYKEIINEWLENDLKAKPKQRHTAKRIYERLKETFPDQFDVSERTVRKYVAARKKELRTQTDGFLPLDHYPGEAQADFGKVQFVENGSQIDGVSLNLSFPFSNTGYLQLFKSENQECLLEGLQNIFRHIGKVPECIWFDNPSTIVTKIREHGKRDKTECFERFELHYGFKSSFCNPNAGHEKGSVENKVGYHRRNFLVPIPEFKNIEEFNKELLEKCDADLLRNHYSKRKPISELFKKDKVSMLDLPARPFDVFRLEKVKTDKYGKAKFENRIYSTSPEQAEKEVWVKASANNIEILNPEYKVIQAHKRLYGNQKESMKWTPYLNLMAKRPKALKYTGFFKELPQSLQDYFDKCEYQQKKVALNMLVKMVEKTDLQTATIAFELATEKGVNDADSIWTTFHTLTSNTEVLRDLDLNNSKVPELKPFQVNIGMYDFLLKGGSLN